MRRLIITGATGGLGTEVVQSLSRMYECVALTRSRADLGDPDAVRKAVREIGAPYGLVHLAGGFAGGTIESTSDETWRHMLDLNLTAAFVVIRETLALMDRTAPGRIVAVSSGATLTKDAGMGAYVVSKAALNALIEVLARELRGSRITANAVLPSSLDTPAMRQSMPREQLVPLAPVAETIGFLLSDSAAHVNGALIPLVA